MKRSQPNSTISRLRLMRLEPRMLFDGAAMAEAVDALHDGDDASSHEPAETHEPSATESKSVVDASDSTEAPVQYFDFDVSGFAPEFQEAAKLASQTIFDFAKSATDEQWFALFNGGNDTADADWLARLADLRAALLDGSLNISVQAIDFGVMPDAIAAFTANGPDGGMTIFVNTGWTNLLDTPDLTRMLIEEYGHAIDHVLNDGGDTPGEEGEHFAAVLLDWWPEDAAAWQYMRTADHYRTIVLDGVSYEVETATFTFASTYEMVYGMVNGTPSLALKENSSIWFDMTDLGASFIDDTNTNSQYFSGNDISAIGINIGGTDYYGWISRAIKSEGVVRGFYFWTDADFTNLASAQADGNRDGDNDPTDNRGFILVVDPAWFAKQTTIAVEIGGKTVTVANVKSSSDRVDSALNTEVEKNPPPPLPPTIVLQAESAVAVEEGYGEPGSNASGNVLGNAQSASGEDLTVTQIGTGNSVKDVGSGTTIDGKYGTLTIHADGSFEYVVDNANPKVDALNEGDTLNDVFIYTVGDGKGGFASATLTIEIQGSNDAPEANPDYNTAKVSITGNPGYDATGNVLTNDTDVDDTTSKYVDGMTVVGTANVGTVAVTVGVTNITFEGGANGTGQGDVLYILVNGAWHKLYGADDNPITSSIKVTGSLPVAVSNAPAYYYSDNSRTTKIAFDGASGTSMGFIAAAKATTEVAASNSAPSKTIVYTSVSSTGTTTLINLDPGSLKGVITVGMTVTGNGVPANARITEIIYDPATGLPISIKVDKEFTSSTPGTFTFEKPAELGQEIQGAYGTLTLYADGSYIYKPTPNNPNLRAGQSVVESFDYTMRDHVGGLTSSSTLYITVYGSGADDLAGASGTAKESGVQPGSNTPEPGSDATGTVLSAGKPWTEVLSYSRDDGTAQNAGGALQGAYGQLTIQADGTYVYVIDNDNTTVNALQVGSTLTETFVYKVTKPGGETSVARLTITIQGTNDAPIAENDTAAVAKGGVQTANGNVLDNDTDVDAGDILSVSRAGASAGALEDVTGSLTIEGAYGTLTIHADGSYTYVLVNNPGSGVVTNDVFTYEVKDSQGATDTATLTITVTGANEAPVNHFGGEPISDTGPTTVTTSADTPLDFTGDQLLSVDDADGNLSEITLEVDHGTLSFISDELLAETGVTITGSGQSITLSGSQAALNAALALLRYTPDNGFYGTDFLTINSADSEGARDSDGIAIVIPTESFATVKEAGLSTGSAPDSGDEIFTGTLTLGDGHTLEAQTGALLDGSGNEIGTWKVNSDGSFSVTLTSASSATASQFSYVVYDDYGNAINNIVNVTIVDDSPIASPDTDTVVEGGTTTGNVLTNDVAGADGPATVVGVRSAGGDTATEVTSGVGSTITGLYGTLTLNADGSYSYTANSVTSTQTDTFVYTIEDGDGSRSTTTLTITVSSSSVNIPATFAGDTTASVTEDSGDYTRTGTITVTDPDSPETVVAQTDVQGKYGSFSIDADGNWTYVADNAKLKPLSTTAQDTDVFTITSADGTSFDIVITLNGINDAPTAANDSFTTAYNTPKSGTLPDASDVDSGQTVTYAKGSDPAHGTVVVSADGSYTYTPDTDYVGTDSFTYTVSDGIDSNTYTVSITVSANVPATFAGDTTASVTEDSGDYTRTGTITVTDPDSPETVVAQSGVEGKYGSFSIDADGNWTYVADNAKLKPLSTTTQDTDVFTITSADGTTFDIVITLNGINDAPTAADDSFTTAYNTPKSGTLPDASDVDSGQTVTYAKGSDPSHGTVVVNADGSYTYTPATDYTGTDSFTYTVSDGIDSNTYTVSITISANVPATFAGDTTASVTEDSGDYTRTGTITVTDPDSPETIVAQTDVEGKYGTFSIDADGNWTYVADNAKLQPLSTTAQDTDVFTITSADGTTFDIVITLNGVNDAPTAANDSFTTAYNTAKSGSLPDASDVDSGQTVTYAKGSDPSHGTVVVNADGSYTYTPATDYVGTDSFTYTVSDGIDSNTYTVTITVSANVPAPTPPAQPGDTTPPEIAPPPPSVLPATPATPPVSAADSSAAVAPVTTTPSLHVLVAVQEARDQTGGAGSSVDMVGLSSVGAGLTTDPSLHVLPAVEAASRSHHNASRNAQQQFERNDVLHIADDENDKTRSPSSGAADFSLDLSEPGADADTPVAAPPTDAGAGDAGEDVAASTSNPSTQALDAPAAKITENRTDIAAQLQRLSRHHRTKAQAEVLAQQLAEPSAPTASTQPVVPTVRRS
ncbi:VCBS domain-containing protein [Azonexus sp.]|jgi:VCBS repeat-containing protein|uniref:VCBS domain-containing protein n=1 Tax=Azonexus sp. TaxID=1872668 RepID=UPI0028267EAD|nr:VCBS domain-containing protein [Azonexus sp.]MDR1994742.1 VCBS domain-containing protein [Azonexus sp.]